MNNITKIYKKYKLTDNPILFDLIINLCLLVNDYRNIFQIVISKKFNNKLFLTEITNIVNILEFDFIIIKMDTDNKLRPVLILPPFSLLPFPKKPNKSPAAEPMFSVGIGYLVGNAKLPVQFT